MLKVLVVEDSEQCRQLLSHVLTHIMSGFEVEMVAGRDEALVHIARTRVDVLLLDLLIPSAADLLDLDEHHAEEVYASIRELQPHACVMVVTSETGGSAVIRWWEDMGVDGYVIKGDEAEDLPLRLEEKVGHWVCRSTASAALCRELSDSRCLESFVILQGPAGSGKEYLARLMHRCCRGHRRRFVAMDLLQMPREGLVPAIQAALEEAPGLMFVANFDGIAPVEEEEQGRLAALLRGVGKDRWRYRDPRDGREREVDTRLVLGSNGPLDDLADAGRLCDDLQRALRAAATVRVPAARERPEDAGTILHILRRRLNRATGRAVRRVEAGVTDIVMWLLRKDCLPGGWDDVERLFSGAYRKAAGDGVAAADVDLDDPGIRWPPVEPEYRLVWSRDGEVWRGRGREPHRIALESENRPLVLLARSDGRTPTVHTVRRGDTESHPAGVVEGRVLYLLADRAGDAVELARFRRELGIPARAPIRQIIYRLRKVLGADGERLLSRYSETYEFSPTPGFALIEALGPEGPPSETGQTQACR